MTKIIKKLIVLFLIAICFSSCAYATETIFSTGNDWEVDGKSGSTNTMDTTELEQASTQLFNLFFDVGIGVVAVVGAFLGIKFMTAGVEEKAEVKETLFPYIISSVVLVGAYGIWKVVVVILKDLI